MASPRALITIRMSRPEIAELDRIARSKGYNRSELLRLIIRRGLAFAGDFAPKDFAPAVRPGGPPERVERAPPAA